MAQFDPRDVRRQCMNRLPRDAAPATRRAVEAGVDLAIQLTVEALRPASEKPPPAKAEKKAKAKAKKAKP